MVHDSSGEKGVSWFDNPSPQPHSGQIRSGTTQNLRVVDDSAQAEDQILKEKLSLVAMGAALV